MPWEMQPKIPSLLASLETPSYRSDFGDELALISQTFEQAQLFLLRVESAAEQLGFYMSLSNWVHVIQPIWWLLDKP